VAVHDGLSGQLASVGSYGRRWCVFFGAAGRAPELYSTDGGFSNEQNVAACVNGGLYSPTRRQQDATTRSLRSIAPTLKIPNDLRVILFGEIA
jgi:hypothetical protein